MGLTVHAADDLPFGEHGEAFVEPEVLEVLVGDQVAGPAVGDLVGNHIGQAPVAGQQGRGGEGQAGVLHPAIGEAGWQHQDVIDAPHVRPTQLLGLGQHGLRLGEVVRRLVDELLLAPDVRPGSDLARLDVAGGDRDQVRLDRDFLHEPVDSQVAATAAHGLGLALPHGGH